MAQWLPSCGSTGDDDDRSRRFLFVPQPWARDVCGHVQQCLVVVDCFICDHCLWLVWHDPRNDDGKWRCRARRSGSSCRGNGGGCECSLCPSDVCQSRYFNRLRGTGANPYSARRGHGFVGWHADGIVTQTLLWESSFSELHCYHARRGWTRRLFRQ